MKRITRVALCGLLLMGMTSCGGSRKAPVTKKSSDEAEAVAKTAIAEVPKVEPVKPPPAPPPPAAEAPKPVEAKPAPMLGKASGAESEQVAGKTIGEFVILLGSANEQEVKEAIEVCRMVGRKASGGIPKLTELTKHPNKEIADSAAEALKAVSR